VGQVLLDQVLPHRVGLNQVWSNQVRLNRNRVDVAGPVVERVRLNGSMLKSAGQATCQTWACLALTRIRQMTCSRQALASTGGPGWRPCQPVQPDRFSWRFQGHSHVL